MKVRHLLLPLAAVLALTTAQAQVKVGANPGTLAPGAVLDAEGSSGARTVIMNDGRVGVNTSAPNTSADLELGSANKALFLNRVANTGAITAPQPGMVIYDLSVGCVKTYQGNPAAWSDCLNLVGSVSALNCATSRFSPGSATQNQAYSGTLTVPYSGGNGGSYPAQSFTANDFTFTLAAGYFQQGSGNLVYTVTGTPLTAGIKSFSITAGGQGCNGLALFVNTAAPTNATGAGTFTGKACFDIVESNDNTNNCGMLSNRTINRANFQQSSTYNQVYIFTPNSTVSNVRFSFVNANGLVIQSISGGNSGSVATGTAVAAMVTYNPALSSSNSSTVADGLAYGLTSSNPLTADIYVVFNDGTGDKQLKLTASVKDCACCGAFVSPSVWKNFMCHNLGADYTADPFSSTAAIHGAKYQWGSFGWSPYKEGTNPLNASSDWITQAYDQANSGSFSTWGSNRWGNRDNLWNFGDDYSPIKSSGDPCPSGYRIPSYYEWKGVVHYNSYSKVGTFGLNNNTNYGAAGKFGTTLLLPAAGNRRGYGLPGGGQLDGRGDSGSYWSSKLNYFLTFSTNPPVAGTNTSSMISYGFSLRCIQE